MSETCLVRIVRPGMSELLIKIFPAEHKLEFVEIFGQRGKERWRAIERMMEQFAPRGEHVLKPVPCYEDNKKLGGPGIADSAIPIQKLENYIFKALPKDKVKPDQSDPVTKAIKNQAEVQDLKDMMNEQQKQINALLSIVAGKTKEPSPEVIKKVPESPATATLELECCDRSFKDNRGLKAHQRSSKAHKENVNA